MLNRTCNIFSFPNLSTETNLHAATSPVVSIEEWRIHQAKLEANIFPAIRARVTKKNKLANDAYAYTHTKAQMDLPIGTVISFKDVVRASKGEPPMLTPYTFHSKAQNGAYYVRDQAGGIFHRAIPIEHIRSLFLAKKPDATGVDYMDYILNHRLNANTRRDEYLVKWSVAPLSEATWVDFADIHDYSAITQFLASRDRIPKSNRKTRERNIAQAIALGSQEADSKTELEVTDSKSASENIDHTSKLSTAKRHMSTSNPITTVTATIQPLVRPITISLPVQAASASTSVNGILPVVARQILRHTEGNERKPKTHKGENFKSRSGLFHLPPFYHHYMARGGGLSWI
jgi:hypothetical protein